MRRGNRPDNLLWDSEWNSSEGKKCPTWVGNIKEVGGDLSSEEEESLIQHSEGKDGDEY